MLLMSFLLLAPYRENLVFQGQLTELASEVLSEATEEVADPESELQVRLRSGFNRISVMSRWLSVEWESSKSYSELLMPRFHPTF